MTKKPNVLLLFADQLRFDTLGCAGNPIIQTPHLDALAREGVCFENALTPTPICVAARLSLITGRRGSSTRYLNNDKLPGAVPEWSTIMTLLHGAGYETHGVGKMHFNRRHYGFQNVETQEECPDFIIDDDYLMYLRKNGVKNRFPLGYRNLLYYQPQTSTIPVEHSPEHWVAQRSVNFLREHAKYRAGKPFFLWSSWIAPHPPFAACHPYDTLYNPDEMPLPENLQRPIADLPYPLWQHRARLDGAREDPERLKRIKALYYGQVTHVDECVGLVLSELERLGLSEDTIVIFASDHGDMLGDHGLSQKNAPYAASARIPMIIRWPGKTHPGTRSQALAALTDIFPTLIQGLNLELPEAENNLPGSNLFPQDGSAFCRDEYVVDYGSGMDRWICLRTQTHMYALWAAGGFEELYDLRSDPGERHNILHQCPELAAQLHSRLLAWEHQYGLPESFDQGGFRVYPVPLAPSEAECRAVTINQGKWAENLPEDEQGGVDSFAVAFNQAIGKESILTPEKLSLKVFKAKGGDLTGTLWETAWKSK